MDLNLAGHAIRALSIGGIETCFEVPSFDCCLDIGRCPPGAERRSTLLLTHAHIDHAAGLPYYVSMRALYRYPKPRVYCPAEAHTQLTKILEAWVELQADTDRCTLTPIEPGATIPLVNDSYAKAFRSPHRIACLGYTIVKRVRKLKAEHVGRPPQEIAALAQSGQQIDDVVERPEICFPGDTMIDVIDTEPTVRTARVLMLECTFMEEKVSVKKARAGGHVHLDELAARADLFENEVILLTHFSRRYRTNEIRDAVHARLPANLRSRVRLLVHGDDSERSVPAAT